MLGNQDITLFFFNLLWDVDRNSQCRMGGHPSINHFSQIQLKARSNTQKIHANKYVAPYHFLLRKNHCHPYAE